MILSHNLQQRSAIGIFISLCIIITLFSLFIVWQWRADWLLTHQTMVSLPILDKNEHINLAAAIPDQHLFGQPANKLGNVPVTNLQLVVTGIVKIRHPTQGIISKAYISVAGQPSKIYKIGDELPNGVKLYSITSNTVILENDGRLEKLPLPREKLEFKPRNVEVIE